MSEQNISMTTSEQETVITILTPDLDINNAKGIMKEIDDVLVERKSDNIIIDLSKLFHIDSSGISIILALNRKMGNVADISIRLGNDRIKEVFHVLNVDQFFTFID